MIATSILLQSELTYILGGGEFMIEQSKIVGPENVVHIAEYLLQLEIAAIQSRYYLDLNNNVYSLKQALNHCQGTQLNPESCYSRTYIDQLEKNIQHLMREVEHFLLLLTPDAIRELRISLKLSPSSS